MEQAEMQQILQALAEFNENMDKRFDKIEIRLDRIETKMDKAEENISFLFSEVGSNSLQLKKLIASE